MIVIQSDPIDTGNFKKQMLHSRVGAIVEFEGRVRDINEGQEVDFLEYDAFVDMCLVEGKKILQEAKAKFDILDARVIHRYGKLDLQDVAVWIGTSSIHREAAYAANQYLIDEIKTRLPIWKKEHYVNGESHWVDCRQCYQKSRSKKEQKQHSCHQHKTVPQYEQYFANQIKVPLIGNVGQLLLKNAKVLVIGCGGLGHPVVQGLATSGVGHVAICDPDKIELSNLHRQYLFDIDQIGKLKVEVVKQKIEKMNPFINLEAIDKKIELANGLDLLPKFDLVIDATDNFRAQFLLNDLCAFFKIPFLTASVFQEDGYIVGYDFSSDEQKSCLRCNWKNVPFDGLFGSCQSSGILSLLPQVVGSLVSTFAIKFLLKKESIAFNKKVVVNLDPFEIFTIKNGQMENCGFCKVRKNKEQFKEKLIETHIVNDFEIEVENLSQLVHTYRFVDLTEGLSLHLKSNFHQASWLEGRKIEIQNAPEDRPILIICDSGLKSAQMAGELRQTGLKNIYSLRGGISENLL